MKLGRGRMRRSSAVRSAQNWIREAAIQAIVDSGGSAGDVETFGSQDISAVFVHNVARDTLTITIEGLGPKPRGTTGRKRDLQNLQDAALDALQGILYKNDNQITHLLMTRNVS
jgi:hypothetical protein